MSGVGMDPDAIAALASPEAAAAAQVRQSAYEARQRRAEAREALQEAEDHVLALARRVARGESVEADVVAAIRHREELRLWLEARDLVVRSLDQDPVLRGRR